MNELWTAEMMTGFGQHHLHCFGSRDFLEAWVCSLPDDGQRMKIKGFNRRHCCIALLTGVRKGALAGLKLLAA